MMDRKTLVLIGLCLLFLVLYRPLLRWAGLGRYIEPPSRPPATAVDSTARDTSAASAGPAREPSGPLPGRSEQPRPTLAAGHISAAAPVLERVVELETPLYHATFSSQGARLLAVELTRYVSAFGVSGANGNPPHVRRGEPVPPGDRVVLAGGPLLAVDLGPAGSIRSLGDLTYAVSESLDAAGQTRAVTFTGHAQSGLRVRQTYRVRPDTYVMDLEVEIRGVPTEWRVPDYALTTRSWPLLTDADLLADSRALRATSLVGTNIHRENAGGLLKGPRTFDGNALWAAVQNRYFMSAIAVTHGTARGVISAGERRPLLAPELQRLPQGTKPDQEVAINSLVMGLPSESSPVHRFVVYAGPSEYERLAALGLQLERAVDLGWTWVLPFSRALLRLLNWLYAVLTNYGLAILVLATLVRVLLHPLNMMSMKSMRAMQKLQPELERIKAKYKSDPQAMNAAVMALYKENKVNPAGGCLPMLLQLPLFLALYQVLFNAIELRQAPFLGWMNDLSAPDRLFTVASFPIRLLPLLMLGSGLLSQRLTPTDPRQLPTMYIMNVFMLVFFYNLPSGLVLYWTVMNLLTALQQWMVLRQDGPAPAVVPAASAAHAGSKRRGAAVR